MSHTALTYFFIILSVCTCMQVSGQHEVKVTNDPGWGITDRYDGSEPITLALNNQMHAVLTKADKGAFGVVAIDDKLLNKWLTILKGYSLVIGRFKEKILVIAATDKSMTTSYSNTYVGYMLDPETGKLLLEKTMYKGEEDYFEQAQFYFSPGGDICKLAQRVTASKKRMKIGVPIIGAFTTMSKLYKEVSQTQSFKVLTFDENLEVKNTFSPVIKNGDFGKSVFNPAGELFIVTIRDENHLSVSAYKEEKPAPYKTFELDVDVNTHYYSGASNLGQNLLLLTSEAHPSSLYLSFYFNDSNKDHTLMVSSFDFLKGSKKTVLELFTKSHVKEIEKSFQPLNKKIDDADIGQSSDIQLDDFFEADGKLYVALGGTYEVRGQYSNTHGQSATVINAYDPELKLAFQQLIPRNFSVGAKTVSTSGIRAVSYHTRDKKLCFLANTNKGMLSFSTLYGEIDEVTGKLIKTELLDKSNLKNAMFINANTTLWSDKTFVITYLDPKGITGANFDVMLQKMSFE